MIRGLTVVLALAAGQANAANFYFCWEGENGYTMAGQMTIPDPILTQDIVTERDVTAFKIAGYLDGALLGKWDMVNLTPDTSWILYYDTNRSVFMTPAEVGSGISQAWNAGGDANDCGTPGFGFNLGNYAQDFCLNGVWVEESGMPPETPFLVSPIPVDPFCRVYAPLS